MKKLLIIIPAFPKDESDSFTVPYIQQFLDAFNTQFEQVELTIISLQYYCGKPYVWNGIKVIPMNGNNVKFPRSVYFFIRTFFKIFQLIKKEKYYGILSFWYSLTALYGRFFSYLFSIPHFTYLQGQDVRRTNKYMKYFKPKSASLIAISTFQNNYYCKEFGRKAVHLAPIGINKSFLPDITKGNREIDVIGVGSLIPLKNHNLFFEIIKELKKRKKDLKVMLIGNGPSKNDIEDLICLNELKENVQLMGLLTHKKTLDYMNNSRIFLHTSTFEGGGTVCIEAMALGCQVISTLPLLEVDSNLFHYISDKNSIIEKIDSTLKNNQTFECEINHSLNESCKIIYELFF